MLSESLSHLFLAEELAKNALVISDAKSQPVNSCVVVGGGTMGASIAYLLQRSGINVRIIELNCETAATANQNIDRLYEVAIRRNLISVNEAKQERNQIKVATDFKQLATVDLAVEAVVEEMNIKKQVFYSLDRSLGSKAVLATNTSYLDINEIASAVSDPSRVVGLHFFNPAHIMKLLEIVRADMTGSQALETGYLLAKQLGKIPVLSGVCEGFIGNRILSRYREAADIMLLDGAMPYEVDEAMVAFGYRMGPYEVQDLAGLDIAYANRKRRTSKRDPNRRYVQVADRLVEQGRLGRKTKAGWYLYDEENQKTRDPSVIGLIIEESEREKIDRKIFTQAEIQERLLFSMIDEACAILHEKIARSTKDIDLVTVHGYGFPKAFGGLMYYADQVGVSKIVNYFNEWQNADPILFKPSEGLLEVMKAKVTFSDFYDG